jgi:deazaflavin-dependent oxidoreductase (nitroreductase family)
MGIDGEYEPSTSSWVRDQVEEIENSGGTSGTSLRGMSVIVMTMRGARTGKVRKAPVMRVEHEGRYAAVASMGGAPQNPVWYHNLIADPHVIMQDGTVRREMVAREVTGEEKAEWWQRAVEAFPNYADYQRKTDRQIPVFVLEPVS